MEQGGLTLDQFRAQNRKYNSICRISQIMREMSPDSVATLVAAMKDTSIQTTAIAKVLSAKYGGVSRNMVQRHRGFACPSCAKALVDINA